MSDPVILEEVREALLPTVEVAVAQTGAAPAVARMEARVAVDTLLSYVVPTVRYECGLRHIEHTDSCPRLFRFDLERLRKESI